MPSVALAEGRVGTLAATVWRAELYPGVREPGVRSAFRRCTVTREKWKLSIFNFYIFTVIGLLSSGVPGAHGFRIVPMVTLVIDLVGSVFFIYI